MASSGMQADVKTLRKVLNARLSMFKQTHKKDMYCCSVYRKSCLFQVYDIFRPATVKHFIW